MRKLLTVVLLAGCSVTEPRGLPPIELIIAGQSNAVSPANGEPPVFSTTGHVWVNDFYCQWGAPSVCAREWNQTMIQPTAERSSRANQTWILLADSLYRLTGRDVYVYNVGRGGSSTQQLLTGNNFTAFKAALTGRNICAVVWVQGESESDATAATTYRNMRAMIDTTRQLRAGLAWLVALNSWARPAQLRLIAEGSVIRGPDIDSLRMNPSYFEKSMMEFAGPGFQAHANAWLPVVRSWCAT